jgi:ribosomal protein L11 methyltransferase
MLYPALDVSDSPDAVLVLLDDFSPTAIEERDGGVRVFFSSSDARDAASAAICAAGYEARPVDVPDEDWARRSQEGLEPVTVGRITVFPAPPQSATRNPQSAIRTPQSAIRIVILPSMGFGTGHHATTRMCLDALQRIPLEGAAVVDVGTGSGVLAIAADRLGAQSVLGLDVDEDALRSARESLALNPEARHVTFELADITQTVNPAITSGRLDVVTANLTGALLRRLAPMLLGAVRRGGCLILSGILTSERDDVAGAFRGAGEIVRESQDGEWIGLIVKRV